MINLDRGILLWQILGFMNLNQLAKTVGKSPQFIINLIRKNGLVNARLYTKGYAVLLRKLIALSLYSVSQRETDLLITREKNLLKLLKADSLHASVTWYEDFCVSDSGPTRLLLCGFDLGHPVVSESIQTGFDFSDRETELFSSREMGVDALRALRLYAETYESVLARIRLETRTLASSLRWGREICKLGHFFDENEKGRGYGKNSFQRLG